MSEDAVAVTSGAHRQPERAGLEDVEPVSWVSVWLPALFGGCIGVGVTLMALTLIYFVALKPAGVCL